MIGASVYCPASSGQTLSSVIAACHSDLAVVIIPYNSEHVAWQDLALQTANTQLWGLEMEFSLVKSLQYSLILGK